jgi:glucose/arabinose dehydrogenase
MPQVLKARLGVSLSVLLLGGCGSGGSGPSTPSSPTAPACSATPVTGTPDLTVQQIATGLEQPVDLKSAPGDRSRLFVVEQTGRIRVIRDGVLQGRPFLDITSRVTSGGERGLLALAFHPSYAQNRRFFVSYTNRSGDARVSEYLVSASDPELADSGSEREILLVDHPNGSANHNSDAIVFGPDGKLYIGFGDGDQDPSVSQNLGSPLGKMLRIDVDSGTPYGVPSDNPFVSRPGAFTAIWAYGLRNPWRFSFDRSNGDLYIGDVGENAREEIDVSSGSTGAPGGRGLNYGWDTMEGDTCYYGGTCDRTGLTLPVVTYRTGSEGCSITGGFVYRGCRMPGYQGTYFYGDYCTALVRSFRFQNGAATEQRDWTAQLGRGLISSFGVDFEGELYVLDHRGRVFKIVPVG